MFVREAVSPSLSSFLAHPISGREIGSYPGNSHSETAGHAARSAFSAGSNSKPPGTSKLCLKLDVVYGSCFWNCVPILHCHHQLVYGQRLENNRRAAKSGYSCWTDWANAAVTFFLVALGYLLASGHRFK